MVEFRVSDAAKMRIAEICRGASDGPLYPGLCWASDEKDLQRGRWTVGFFDESAYAEAPSEFKTTIDGVEFLLDLQNSKLLRIMEGKTLDLDRSGAFCFR